MTVEQAQQLKAAAATGDTDSLYVIGEYLSRRNAELAKKTWTAAAERGNVFAMMSLGDTFPGTDQSEKRAWYEKAAAANVPVAELTLAGMLIRGQGGVQDLPRGKQLLLKAAQDGSVDAMNLVGAGYLGIDDSYSSLLGRNPRLAAPYLQAGVARDSNESRRLLYEAYHQKLLPDPIPLKPQLDGGAALVKYLHQLAPEDRVEYLRAQVAKYPQSPMRTKALEEIVWLSGGQGSDAELQALKTQDAQNTTLQVFTEDSELNLLEGRPQQVDAGEIKSAQDVIERWSKATGFDHLLIHSYLLTKDVGTVAEDDNLHISYCATDGKNLRSERMYDGETVASKAGHVMVYRPANDLQNFSSFQGVARYTTQTAYIRECLLNIPRAADGAAYVDFAGLKSFQGVPAYELVDKNDGTEEYFDSKTFLYLGFIVHKPEGIAILFGNNEVGGALVPLYRVYHNGNNVRVIKLESVQWDMTPSFAGDPYTLAFSNTRGFPELLPMLMSSIQANELVEKPVYLAKMLDKLQAAASGQTFGLDAGLQQERSAFIGQMPNRIKALAENTQQWDALGVATSATFLQQERGRRFKNPQSAEDLFYNWRDVSNVSSMLSHKTIQIETKRSNSGSNSTLDYCGMDNEGHLREEGANNSLQINSKDAFTTFDLQKQTQTNHTDTPYSQVQGTFANNLSGCLLGINSLAMEKWSLSTARWGTGTLNQNKEAIYILQFPFGDKGDASSYYLDKASFNLVGSQAWKESPVTYYYDFRRVGDAVLPYKSYEYDGGQFPSDSMESIEKLDFDHPIDQKEFSTSPPVYANLHATVLSEKRPELYKQKTNWLGIMSTVASAMSQPNLIQQTTNQQVAQMMAIGRANDAARQASMLGNAAGKASYGDSFTTTRVAAPMQIPSMPVDTSALLALQNVLQSGASGSPSTPIVGPGALPTAVENAVSAILESVVQTLSVGASQ
ncbi:MAG TPA: hypothetical protein VGS78_03875 [Candidatus Sulfotelmatobacter sp.]|nr:hypothetical protein [Candidatus Sulfotelmatobacter sp.]